MTSKTVELSAAHAEQLEQLATAAGLKPEDLLQQAVQSYLTRTRTAVLPTLVKTQPKIGPSK